MLCILKLKADLMLFTNSQPGIFIYFFSKGYRYIKYHFCPFSYDDKIQNEKFLLFKYLYRTLTRGDLPFLAIIAPAMLECEVIQGLLGHIDLENVL